MTAIMGSVSGFFWAGRAAWGNAQVARRRGEAEQ